MTKQGKQQTIDRCCRPGEKVRRSEDGDGGDGAPDEAAKKQPQIRPSKLGKGQITDR